MNEMQHLAQLNIGRFRYPTDDPRMADFMNNLDLVNGLAERTQGFVWRLKDESDNATNFRPFPDPTMAVNLSVWESVEALERFVWQTVHKRFYGRRPEWFDKTRWAALRHVVGSGRSSADADRGEGAARISRRPWPVRLCLRLGERSGRAIVEDGALCAQRTGRMTKLIVDGKEIDVPPEYTLLAGLRGGAARKFRASASTSGCRSPAIAACA